MRICTAVAASLVVFSSLSIAAPAAQNAQATASTPQLQAVLNGMDKTAATFKTIECKFVWDTYTAAVDDHAVENGTIYFRRLGPKNVEMAAQVDAPDSEHVLYSDGVVRIYRPNMGEQRYNAGKNKAEFESFLILGFGGSGHDLTDKFDVQYAGTEAVQGVNAAKLVLTPKEEQVAKTFSQIILWIDPARGISVQQKFIQPRSGDYKLAKYSDIQVNGRLPKNAFNAK